MRRRDYLATALAGVALPALAGCIDDLEIDSETLTVDGLVAGSGLRIANRNGDVTVDGTDRDDSTLQLTKRTRRGVDLERVSVAISTSGGIVELEPDLPAGVGPGEVTLDLHLTVPATVEVGRIQTRNGTVQVQGTAGNPRLLSVNGDVEARTVDGIVAARTTNGDVTVRDCPGIGDLRNTNGDVGADVLAVHDDVQVRTVNGEIGLALGPEVDCDLDVRVTNGEVDASGLDLRARSVGDGFLEGTLGDGGPLLAVETINGDVSLEPL